MDELLDAGQLLAIALSRGWSMIPAKANKVPLLRSWKEFQSRRPTEAELDAWQQLNPAAWAVVTGTVSGLVVLDFDGASGAETLRSLGLQPHRKTGSGGFHVDIRHPGWPVKTLNSKQGKPAWVEKYPGLDIRADGGFAIFAGRNTRGDYSWLSDAAPLDLSMLPHDLRGMLGLLVPPQSTTVASPVGTTLAQRDGSQSGIGRMDDRVSADLLLKFALDRMAAEGRNNAGMWLACQMRDNQYSQTETELLGERYVAAVPDTNTKGHRESYGLAEFRTTIRSAFSRSARDPWASSPHGWGTAGEQSRTATIAPAKVGPDDWTDRLIRNHDKHRTIKALFLNAKTALEMAPEWAGVLEFNEFSMHVAVRKGKRLPWGTYLSEDLAWTDQEDRQTALWLQERGIHINSVDLVSQAVQTVAQQRPYHPVREYLERLNWDGDGRIDTWLTEYLGAEPSGLVAAIGARWLISAVARIFRPGCKVDCCLILEGEQGIKKSTALRTLGSPWFADEIADLGTKDAALQTQGVWILEIAELEGMSRSEVGRIKAFMSRAVDHFRPPYGRRTLDIKRQCVFAGSVNHNEYLKDPTGARRFWPIECRRIDVQRLAADRDQLWAEAVQRYRDGRPWWLDSAKLERDAAVAQAARYEGDPWDALIERWLVKPLVRHDERGHPVADLNSTVDSVSIDDVLLHAVGKPQHTWMQADRTRVARFLQSAGWRRRRVGPRDSREWKYTRLGH